jgi:hypothetical protein
MVLGSWPSYKPVNQQKKKSAQLKKTTFAFVALAIMVLTGSAYISVWNTFGEKPGSVKNLANTLGGTVSGATTSLTAHENNNTNLFHTEDYGYQLMNGYLGTKKNIDGSKHFSGLPEGTYRPYFYAQDLQNQSIIYTSNGDSKTLSSPSGLRTFELDRAPVLAASPVSTASPNPEPTSMVLFGIGCLIGIILWFKKIFTIMAQNG